MKYFNEPMLNLHFFNPFMKSSTSQLSYEILMKEFQQLNTEEENNFFVKKIIDYLKDFKDKLFKQEERKDKVLVLFHVLIFFFTYFKVNDSNLLNELATISHEIRLLPMPYGLLPHELIDILDNERTFHGLVRIQKLTEDLPYL